MYVTRPLSLYRKHPSTLSKEPEEGPYSGYLVITDEEAEAEDTFCWGTCKRKAVKRLPFPQDKILSIVHSSDYQEISATKVWLVPVLDQPLSSNRYYVIRAKGRYKGQACISSRELDMGICCFSNAVHDRKPKPFDFRNIYQQFQIRRHHRHSFYAKSAAIDGIPPTFLRKKGWEVTSSSLNKYCNRSFHLSEALGIDTALRSHLPDFSFPIGNRRSDSAIVGKWYCPFAFIKEEARIRHQMGMSIFYNMTLEQSWEEIYSCVNVSNRCNVVVNMDVNLQRRVDYVFGMEALRDNKVDHGGFVWFRVCDRSRGVAVKVGLSVAIVEKMKWVQEEGGFVDGREREVRVEKVVEITRSSERESGIWRRFACYVLVESFVLSRMDGAVILKCDCRHTHKIQCKCEL